MKDLQAVNGRGMLAHRTQKKEALMGDTAQLVAEGCPSIKAIFTDRHLGSLEKAQISPKHERIQTQRKNSPQTIRKCVLSIQ